MNRFAVAVFIGVLSVLTYVPSFGQQNGSWIVKEFSEQAVDVASVEGFINSTCQPSTFDGLQFLGVQNGHNNVFHLHVYCRQDKAASSHYKVTMVPIPNRNPDAAVDEVLRKPNIRVGPFYFGKDGQPDAFVLIEKTN